METINKDNIHKKKRMSAEKIMPSMLERLYVNDIKKRKEKQEFLIQIYTPTFTPQIYTKEIKCKKNKQSSLDKNYYCNTNTNTNYNKNNNNNEDNFETIESIRTINYESNKLKRKKNLLWHFLP